MGASSFKTSAEYQANGENSTGGTACGDWILKSGPKLMARLQRELADYGAATHPGAALVEWLDDVLPD
ncbi:hypothetical protein [Methylomonas koyamae]|uniref:hypothetical protein n=1 Tax=Methylomonas koyamae TaxID=702114 RepID=UPI00210F8D48|nr:hypothetical protein [Methylomonas koyamae]